MDISNYGYSMSNNTIVYPDNLPLSYIQRVILGNRLDKTDNVEDYIYNDYDIYKDILKLKDVDKAAELLLKHIKVNSHILICSDLDCDGLTSAVTAYKSITEIFKHSNISVIINRRKDGNSFNPRLVQRVKDLHMSKPIDCMISFDQGSRNENEYKDFKSMDKPFDIIITDHHTVDNDNYPSSVDVFVNPQRVDSEYTRNISGCVVGFLVMLYAGKLNGNNVSDFYNIFPFPAISIISDVMSCKELVNRYIYRVGMNSINKLKDTTFPTLRSILGIPGIITDIDIRMKIAPFINSANRMAMEDTGYEMLSVTDRDICRDKATALDGSNTIKKQIVKDTVKELQHELGKEISDGGIVVMINSEAAINGLIAARIGEMKKAPTVCFINNDSETISGSCRAIIKGFDLLSCLQIIQDNHPDVIVQYGGHKDACGVTIYRDKYEDFKTLFYKHSKEILETMDIDYSIKIDAVLKDKDINPDLWNEISTLAPYGKDFPDPIFASVLTLSSVMIMGSYCRLTFKKSNGGNMIGFYSFEDNLGLTIENIREVLERGNKYLVSFTFNISSYRGSYDFNYTFLKIDEIS